RRDTNYSLITCFPRWICLRGLRSPGVLWPRGKQQSPRKTDTMKNTGHLLIAAAAAAVLAAASQAYAGGSTSCCSASRGTSGITASPKVQAMLEERCKSQCAASAQVASTVTTPHTLVAASPKIQQIRSERAGANVMETPSQTAGYQPTGADGISASPKLRAVLEERRQPAEITPLK